MNDATALLICARNMLADLLSEDEEIVRDIDRHLATKLTAPEIVSAFRGASPNGELDSDGYPAKPFADKWAKRAADAISKYAHECAGAK